MGLLEPLVLAFENRVRPGPAGEVDLREVVNGREATPSAACVDSQTVKTTEMGGTHGYDGAKKINGRKRDAPLFAEPCLGRPIGSHTPAN